MKQVQRGFTLIELVMVIVILGILAAVALPKFVDLGEQARTAATAGVAGALASASAINYAAVQVGNTSGVSNINTCDGMKAFLQGGTLPSTKYSIGATSEPATSGQTGICTLTNSDGGDVATWSAIGS